MAAPGGWPPGNSAVLPVLVSFRAEANGWMSYLNAIDEAMKMK
jgi:hypothetical protein